MKKPVATIHDWAGQSEAQINNLAMGRIFRLASRQTQPGDIDAYERCRTLIMDLTEASGGVEIDHRPNYARDSRKGAQGD